MQKILMILTKDRHDCVDMNLLLHERGGSFDIFDKVVFLLNDVTPRHMRFIDNWIARHPTVSCDKIIGDGTRPKGIADMQNRCIQKYPGAFYAKTDEDVFVPPGWARMMWEAYEAHCHLDNLALITPLMPNNAYGLYILLNHFYPEYLAEFRHRFNRDPDPKRDGFTWISPHVAEWSTRKFINLTQANEEQRRRLETRDMRPETSSPSTCNLQPATSSPATCNLQPATSNQEQRTKNQAPSSPSTLNLQPSTSFPATSSPSTFNLQPSTSSPATCNLQPASFLSSTCNLQPATCNQEPSTKNQALAVGAFHSFNVPFSIGCIAYDYRHIARMGGVPDTDEPGWCKFIEEHNQTSIIDCRQIALHYTFFVQQQWLDRSSLLEDIRRVNLSDTMSIAERLGLHRAARLLSQIPAIAKRKFLKLHD